MQVHFPSVHVTPPSGQLRVVPSEDTAVLPPITEVLTGSDPSEVEEEEEEEEEVSTVEEEELSTVEDPKEEEPSLQTQVYPKLLTSA